VKKTALVILLLHATTYYSILAQTKQKQELTDSLLTVLKSVKKNADKSAPTIKDTAIANVLYELSKIYWYDKPDTAIDYAKQSLLLSQQIGFKKGIGFAYYSMGVSKVFKNDLDSAMELTTMSLKTGEQIGDKHIIASAYLNIGVIFDSKNNFPEALKNFFTALKIAEEIGDRQITIWSYDNIARAYELLGNYQDASANFSAVLKINLEIGDKQSIASDYTEIGLCDAEQNKYSEALKYHFLALKISEAIEDKPSISSSYINIGYVYQQQGNYPEALKYYFSHLKISKELADSMGIAGSYEQIGQIYSKQKRYDEASDYLSKGLKFAKSSGSLPEMKADYQTLSEVYNAQALSPLISHQNRGEYAMKALEYYKLFIDAHDSLFNSDNTKKITQLEMQYAFDKKEALAKAEQEKKDDDALKKMQKQRLVRNALIGGFGIMLLFAGIFWSQRNTIKKGKKLSDDLLLNILPEEVAEELKEKGSAKAKQFDEVTVMFTDFKNFTQLSEKLSPSELVAEIHTCFKTFDGIIDKYNIEKIKTIGDSYMCAGGLPVINKNNATDVVNAAIEIQQFILKYFEERIKIGKEPFEVRIGIHSGPVVAGIVGIKKFAYDIWGDTVNIASRMESSGEAGKVNISGATYELVKEKFNCTHRGKITAKNKGEIDMYFVESILL
jgi:adenylate cyclase